MSATYGVSGSSPFADFTTDFEDLVLQYLYNEWSISDPAKPAAMQGNNQDLEFRPGFRRNRPAYQVLCIQTDTPPPEDQEVSRRSWKFMTSLEITIVVRRINRDNIDPQLGNMEREVQRIISQYRKDDIPGIVDMFYRGQARVYEDTIAGGTRSSTIRESSQGAQNAFSTVWQTRVYCDIMYYKDDIT